MGCRSGKVSAPGQSASGSDQRTLLTTPAPPQSSLKEDFLPRETRDIVSTDAAGSTSPLGFNGRWSSGAVNTIGFICDNGPMAMTRRSTLTWFDGTTSHIQVNDMTKSIEISYNGAPFTGELRDDDCIHWSDGDIWTRDPELVEAKMTMDVPAQSRGDIGPYAAQDCEEANANTWADSKTPRQTETTTDMKAEAAPELAHLAPQPRSPGEARGMDRISIDTADLDLPAGEAGGLKGSSGKQAHAKPRKERCTCCC